MYSDIFSKTKKLVAQHKLLLLSFIFFIFFSAVVHVSATALYNPGDTLNPTCAPGSANCTVQISPDQTGNSGKFLMTDGTTMSWAAVTATAAGSNTDVQFNNSGVLGASGNLTFNTGTNLFTVNGNFKIDSNGNHSLATRTVTASTYTIDASAPFRDDVIYANTGSGPNDITITLPASGTSTAKRDIYIEKVAASHVVTIVPNGSDTINGQASIQLTDNTQSVHLESMGTGTAGEWSATFNFIDSSYVSPIDVTVATTANLSNTDGTSYSNGSSGVGATITENTNGALVVDGVTLAVNNTVLVKDQSTNLQNGVYTVTAIGDSTHQYVLTRASGSDMPSEFSPQNVVPANGTTNHGILYSQTATVNTVGTDPVVYSVSAGVASTNAITQVPASTNIANYIPVYTSTLKQLTAGTANFAFNASGNTFTVGSAATSGNRGGIVISGSFFARQSASAISIGAGTADPYAGGGSSGTLKNVVLGPGAGAAILGSTITATNDILIGNTTGKQITGTSGSAGSNNVIIGNSAGSAATPSFTGLTTQSSDTFIGNQSGYLNAGSVTSSAQSDSTFLGYSSGMDAPKAANSIFIGYQAGLNDTVDNTSSGHNILIGDNTSTGAFQNSIALGTSTANTSANQFAIGSSGFPINSTFITGSGGTQCTITTGTGISCSSDETLKTDINDLPTNTLDALDKVRTVTYHWKDPAAGTAEQVGYLAQDLQQYFPDLVTTAPNNTLSVNYAQMTPIIVEAVRELDMKVDNISSLNASDTSIADQIGAFLSSESDKIINGVVHLENLVVGSSQKPAGITLYDTATGSPYCFQITNGQDVTTPGECGTVQPQQSVAPPAPAPDPAPASDPTVTPASDPTPPAVSPPADGGSTTTTGQ